MSKTLFYNEGPKKISFGIAGDFYLGVPREVEDFLANVLLRKGILKELKVGEEKQPLTKERKRR